MVTPFATVDSISIGPESALALQRAGVATGKPWYFEMACIARERAVPTWAERVRFDNPGEVCQR